MAAAPYTLFISAQPGRVNFAEPYGSANRSIEGKSLAACGRCVYKVLMDAFIVASEVIAAALRVGVRDFVICAGARNAALVEVLAQAEQAGLVTLWRHFEERSAGFFALGRTISQRQPCAVVTTSGTAAAELLPSMIEAFYQQRPLLAITADRPARFRGTGAPQAIEQVGLFGVYAGAGNVADWPGIGPWHCNVELEEEFSPGVFPVPTIVPDSEPESRSRLTVGPLARWLREDTELGVVVLLGGLEPEEQEEVWHFLNDLQVPVLADATSGLREALGKLGLPDGDRLLRENPPAKVLRIGDIPTGRFWRDLERLPDTQVWSISRCGFTGLARESQCLKGSAQQIIKSMGSVERIGDPLGFFLKTSRRAAQIEDLLESFPESEAAWVRTISAYASFATSIFLGNSLPVREWNLFAQHQRPVPLVRANRGANGIDGQLSTWLGATAREENAWAMVGDLTALYDLAAPFLLGPCETKGRVLVVINNGGGRIFERLPRLADMQSTARELMVNPHAIELAGWAAMWGMNHCRVSQPDDLDNFTAGETMTLLEIIPDRQQTVEFWERWDRLT